MPESPKTLIRFLDSVLMREAQSAVGRSHSAEAISNPIMQAGACFTAVVAAAGSVEAYLSELLAHLEEAQFITSEERTEVKREEGLWRKFNRLAQIFGAPSDALPARPEYSRLTALIKLRNALIHRSADFLPLDEWPEELRNVRTLIPHEKGTELDWTSQVLVPATAAWAVQGATKILAVMDEFIPDPARMPALPPGGGA
jgi:hypothetical protein